MNEVEFDDDGPIFLPMAIFVACFVLALIGWRAATSPPVPARGLEPAAICEIDDSDGDAIWEDEDGGTSVRIGDEIYRSGFNKVPCSWLKNRRARA